MSDSPLNKSGVESDIGTRYGYLLRYSPDWLTVLYTGTVSELGWKRIEAGFSVRASACVFCLDMKKETATERKAQCEGIFIRAMDPSRDWAQEAKLTKRPMTYPVEVQIQGHAWSMGVDIDELLKSIEENLGIAGQARIQGRLDLSADFALSPTEYQRLICHGSYFEVREFWSTRAQKVKFDAQEDEREPKGMKIEGRGDALTLYLGSRSGAQLSIYRKDVRFAGNTASLIESRWRSNGWNGSDYVVRVEFRLAREWFREHTEGKRKLGDVPVEEVEALYGGLWRHVTKCFRLTDRRSKDARRNRPDDPLWDDICHAWDDYSGKVDVKAAENLPDLNNLIKNMGCKLVDLEFALGKVRAHSTVGELEGSAAFDEYRKRSRWKKVQDARDEQRQSDRNQNDHRASVIDLRPYVLRPDVADRNSEAARRATVEPPSWPSQ